MYIAALDKQLTTASNGTNSLTFEYNEDGLRQKKTVNNVDTDYFYNGSVLIGMQQNNDVLRFSYDASGSVVSVNYNGTEYYYLRNAQGDIVKLIDASGATVVEYTYDTWGKEVQTTGSLAGTLGTLQPFRYRGYVYDEETGFYYLESRYYDPEVGRFISADVLLSPGQGVLGHNCYAYCNDNPVALKDEGGCVPSYSTMETDTELSYAVHYNVPFYFQGYGRNLCWATCQVMIESYYNREILSQEEAQQRAKELAQAVYGEDDWNQGGWPTNISSDCTNDLYVYCIEDLYELLRREGPLYAYYSNDINRHHLVVITGADPLTNEVFINNPNDTNERGQAMSFSQFLKYYKNGYYNLAYPSFHYIVIPEKEVKQINEK